MVAGGKVQKAATPCGAAGLVVFNGHFSDV
jgi:hypothetical protein